MILVVGATGYLGRTVCLQLAAKGESVRALVRPSAPSDLRSTLSSAGVELVEGDLKDSLSLERACQGAKVVVSTASASLSRREGDSIQTVDRDGNLALIDAAEKARVEQFVFVSFHPMDADFPLQEAKRQVEARLRSARLRHTILQPTYFTETWLSAPLGFDPGKGQVTVYGDGNGAISWISLGDVAAFVVGSVKNPQALDKTFELGGGEALTLNQIIARVEEGLGRPLARQQVPQAALEAQWQGAEDPLQKTFAGLALNLARGYKVDPSAALAAIPVTLRPVDDHLRALLAAAGS